MTGVPISKISSEESRIASLAVLKRGDMTIKQAAWCR